MVARIAPSPIASTVAIGDALAHAPEATLALKQHAEHSPDFATDHGQSQLAANIPPSAPPGEAFAAAVIAGQLAPRPVTTDELRQRLGAAWQPPASPLRLMDKSA